MTLEQAKQARDKYSKLIGTRSPLGMDIIDIIVEPITNGQIFRDEYVALLRNFKSVSNDGMLHNVSSEKYQVTVVLDSDGGLTTLLFDDIKEYSTLI